MSPSRVRSVLLIFAAVSVLLAAGMYGVGGWNVFDQPEAASAVVGPSPGPVAAYSFDEGEGTTLTDITGNGHDGTIEGATWTRGKYGGALEFSAESTTGVTIPDSPELQLSEELTLEAWVRPNHEYPNQTIITKETENFFSYGLNAGGEEYGVPGGYTSDADYSEYAVNATSALPVKAWSHLALTFDGAKMRLYVDGALVGTKAGVSPQSSGGILQIGRMDVFGQAFDGRIDEVRIYNRALSAGEVQGDLAAPIQTPQAGPVAAYSFDEGEGTEVEDLTGDGHTATIEGAEWTTHGKYGGAMEFSRPSLAHLTVADAEDLDLSEELTLEAWVRPSEANHYWEPILAKEYGGEEGESKQAYSLYAGQWEQKPYGQLEGSLGEYEGAIGEEPLPKKTWSHVAMTFDGAKLRLYVDGKLTEAAPAPAPRVTAGDLEIGGFAEHNDYFDGRIDEVRIYNRALNTAEVAGDMEAPIQTPQQGPVAAYSFDEGEGTTAEDLTGNAHTATIHGAEWTTQGRYGGAIGFAASEHDYLSIPASTELDNEEELTVEAWVRPTATPYFGEIAMKEREGSGPGYSWTLDQRETEAAGYFMQTEEGMVAGPQQSLPNKTWTHVALTDDGAHNRLYVNGKLLDTEPAIPFNGHGEIRIGGNALFGQWFDGRIDELRIYDRALNAAEVAYDTEAPIQTPKATPVAAYSFDEGEGTTVEDLTGDGHTATIEGASWARGRYGKGLSFNASEEDVVKVPDSFELDFSEEFTLEAWVRPSQLNNEWSPAITKSAGEGEGSQSFAYRLYEGGAESNHPLGAIKPDPETSSYLQAAEALPKGAWSQIAMTYDGASIHLFIDGVEVNEAPSKSPAITNGDLEIGGASALGDFFDGRIDEVRIYNRALSTAEVATDMEAPIQTPQQGPIAAYSFDEGEGETAEDLTGDEHTATIEGATWARGKYGGALQFNGTSSCVSIADATDLRLGEEFTLESWVRAEGELKEDPIVFKEGTSYLNYALEVGHASTGKGEGSIGITASPNHKEAASTSSLESSVWTHLATTFDGAKLRLYVNGELVAAKAIEGSSSGREGALKIGCDSQYGEHFEGRIDEVRIYNRALDGGEIQADMAFHPIAVTEQAYGISDTEAVLVGSIESIAEPSTYAFEYGPTTSYGTSVSAEEESVMGKEGQQVEEDVDSLQPEKTYHYRVVARARRAEVYGRDHILTTSASTSSPTKNEELRDKRLKNEDWTGFSGINYDGDAQEAATPAAMEVIKNSNAKMLRIGINGPHADEVFRLAAERGITILPGISGDPTRPNDNLMAAQEEGIRPAWQKKLKEIIERYGNSGTFWSENPKVPKLVPKYWEIWNEPNYATNGDHEGKVDAPAYGDLLEESHAVITGIDPKAEILVGGLLTVTRKRGPVEHRAIGQFIEEMGHPKSYEALSLHPYAFAACVDKKKVEGQKMPKCVPKSPTSTPDVQHVTATIKRNISNARKALDRETNGSKKPILITEFGWPVGGPKYKGDEHHWPVNQAIQRELLNATFTMLKKFSGPETEGGFNLEKVLFYNNQDQINGEEQFENWAYRCGLIEEFEEPKPKFKSGEFGKVRKAWAAFVNQAE